MFVCGGLWNLADHSLKGGNPYLALDYFFDSLWCLGSTGKSCSILKDNYYLFLMHIFLRISF